jgi:hypothetical protein
VIGLQTALLPAADWRAGLALFEALAREAGLVACEVHLAADHYAAACPATDAVADELRARLRPAVARLGVHLPFAAAGAGPGDALAAGVAFAARAGADVAVLHLRGAPAAAAGWAARIAPLAARARDLGVALCVENADEVRDPRLAGAIAAASGAGLCLDLGHLHERVYPERGARRKLLVANDRFNPWPFACPARLPAAACGGGWARALAELAGQVAWIHIHDHDGRAAHRPLGAGRIRWAPPGAMCRLPAVAPVILEADHRGSGPDAVRADIRRLKELLGT